MNTKAYEHEYVSGRKVSQNHIYEIYTDSIGNESAELEWINESEADSQFIKIDSYSMFAKQSCTFLVGRIGTGKTAMLNKLKYSIDQGEDGNYSTAVLIDSDISRDYIGNLGPSVRSCSSPDFSYTEVEAIARKRWDETINIIAMKAAYDKYCSSNPGELNKIRTFLRDQGILEHRFNVKALLNNLAESLSLFDDYPIVQGVAVGVSLVLKNCITEYKAAKEELYTILKKHGNMLILIDSIELYEFKDRTILAILNALVNLCDRYSLSDKGLYIKLATPSELIPNLTSLNLEKIQRKMVYIRWSQKDLKKLIAVRMLKRQKNNTGIIDIGEALEYFDSYYDEYCMTINGFRFQTFAYCTSHTQKKPRQIISIFNTWISLEKLYPSKDRMSLIDEAIAYNELERIKGALQLYSSVHPEMFNMFLRTFTKKKYCFEESEFDKWISSCSSVRGKIDAFDLKRYFIASGLVGTMTDMHYIQQYSEPFQNRQIIRIKEVLFEYQFKEILPFNSSTKFCLHPMCFRALDIEIDKNTFVYPVPLETDDDYIPWSY